MEGNRLYYTDSHLTAFEATVTGCAETKGGYAVTLSATAFYPEGGGQAYDTGTLGDAKVLSVREEAGAVVHLCDKALRVGSTVIGNIDWQRRFDLMQQHSGEHMVSGVAHTLYGCHNVGFHMGADVVTIDFDYPIPPEDLEKIENTVNAAIWQNLPVRCYTPTREALPNIPYRRKRDLPWPVRVVEIPGIDLCACCGTHVKYTGEIGLVKLFSCVKFHEGVRMEMACGKRALDILNAAHHQNRLVSQAFSAKWQETGAAAARMNEALSQEKFRSASLQKQVFQTIANSYAGKRLALHFEETLTPAENRALCDAIAQRCGIAVTLAGADATGYSLCIISRDQDAKAMGTAATQALNGRGGGKKEAFQGTISATKAEIQQYFVTK